MTDFSQAVRDVMTMPFKGAAAAVLLVVGLMAYPAHAQTATCARLEAQLARASQASGSGSEKLRKWTRAVDLQRQALATTERQYRRADCAAFGQGDPLCDGIATKIKRMKANLRKLRAGVKRLSRGKGNGNARRIRAIKARLSQLHCGPGTRQPRPEQRTARQRNPQPQGRIRTERYAASSDRRDENRSEDRRPSGLLGMIFRGRSQERSTAEYRRVRIGRDADPRDVGQYRARSRDDRPGREPMRDERQLRAFNMPRNDDSFGGYERYPGDYTRVGGSFRTLCVRTCDGYYFPISYSTASSNFYRDQLICEQMCPNTEVKLFVHRSPGEESEDMATVDGQPYADMDYAFAYRKTYNPACSCGRVQPRAMTPVDTDNLPALTTIAGRVDVHIRDSQPSDIPAKPIEPAPAMKKIPVGADPDTVENLHGNFSPLAVANSRSRIASAARSKDRKIRRVGPAYVVDP